MSIKLFFSQSVVVLVLVCYEKRYPKLPSQIRQVLQNEYQYDFRKGPREILSGTVITVLKAIKHVNTVNTVPAEISRGVFRKSYRNSYCKTSLFFMPISFPVILHLSQHALLFSIRRR